MSKPKPSPKTLPPTAKRDLVVLAADKDTEQVIVGLLGARTKSLQIRVVKYDTTIHPQHDPGCLLQSGAIVNRYVRTHEHAIVVFDRHGCGQDEKPREALEAEVEALLAKTWGDRAAVIVIVPELEAWVWTKPSHIPHVVGWLVDKPLPDWLVEKGFLDLSTQVKPVRQKEALDAALHQAGEQHSSDIFRRIAEKVSFGKCTDPAFLKLLTTLRNWFPAVS